MKTIERNTSSGIHVTSVGQGPDLLVIAGGPGISSQAYVPAFSRLADCFTCHIPDARGTGRSTLTGPYSFATDLHDLQEVVAELKLLSRGFSVFGHSYGGLLALSYSMQAKQGLRGLVLCGTAPDLKPALADIMTRKAARLGPQFASEYARVLGEMAAGRVTERLKSDFLTLEARCQVLDLRQPEVQKFASEFDLSLPVFASNTDWLSLDLSSRLSEIAGPVLVVSGAEDIIVPPGESRVLAGISNAEFVEIPECGHWPFVERPREFDLAMRTFAERLG